MARQALLLITSAGDAAGWTSFGGTSHLYWTVFQRWPGTLFALGGSHEPSFILEMIGVSIYSLWETLFPNFHHSLTIIFLVTSFLLTMLNFTWALCSWKTEKVKKSDTHTFLYSGNSLLQRTIFLHYMTPGSPLLFFTYDMVRHRPSKFLFFDS